MSSEAMTGTFISDFLVIGDVRDLGKQGYKAATGQEVDRMVAGFSALGIATSVASAIPQPGEPAVASADLGISLLKALRKVNALTNRFTAEAFVFAKDAVKARKLGRFGELAENLKDLARNAPAGTLGTAMKEVESLDDLKTITKWSQLAPNETIVLLDAGRGSWLKANSVVHKKKLGVALRKGPATMIKARPYIRGTKFLFRGRLQEFRERLIDAIMAHPALRRVSLWVGIISSLSSVAILMVLASPFFRTLQQKLWVSFGSSRSPSM